MKNKAWADEETVICFGQLSNKSALPRPLLTGGQTGGVCGDMLV